MPKVIDPNHLTPRDLLDLASFFIHETVRGVQHWKKDTPYTFSDGSTFTFSNAVIRRARKEGKVGHRFEFISQQILGSGGFSHVFQVLGTLAIEPDAVCFKPYGALTTKIGEDHQLQPKKRVIKIQTHDDMHPIDCAYREYEISKKVTHLGIKPPTIIGNISCMVMKELRKCELFDIINADLDGSKIISLSQRLEISIALLKAVKEQAHDRGVVHGDIKAENIFVDINHVPIKIYLYDFGLGVLMDKPQACFGGTFGYFPYEVLSKGKKTIKSDLFSTGILLKLLWRGKSPSMDHKGNQIEALNPDLDSLFDGLEDLSPKHAGIIHHILANMMMPEPGRRISFEQAIHEFSSIRLEGPQPLSMPIKKRKNVGDHYAFFAHRDKKPLVEDAKFLPQPAIKV